MDVLQNMMLLSELVQCGGNVYTWCYDAQGVLLRSNCPDEAFLASAFELFGCKQRMLEHGNRDDVPVTLGTALGLLWGAAFEKEEGKLKRIWVIGPVFYQDVTLRGIEDGLKYYSKLEISVAWTIQLYKSLEKVPTLQNTIMNRYLLMMHYCLTGQRLELSSVNSSAAQEERLKSSAIPHDRHKIWMAEQGMLQMVRTGDMNYKQALSNSMSMSAGVPVQSSDVLRQSKTSIIVFTSLVCRAAIEGGLSPEEAYSLGDSYIQAAESAKSLDELSPLAMMMYDDFIRRVHKHRTNPNLSMQIQKCVDYIEMNLDKKIVAEDLAVLVGYTEYYLTHKFKEETGLSVTNYVKFAKMERAKVLLKSTHRSAFGRSPSSLALPPAIISVQSFNKLPEKRPWNSGKNKAEQASCGTVWRYRAGCLFCYDEEKLGRMAQLRNFSFRVTPKSRAMARRSSSVMVCRMMPPPMESTLT